MLINAERRHKEEVLTLCEEFFRESKFSLPFSREKVADLYDLSLTSPDIILILYESEGKIVGMLAGAIGDSLFSDEKVATELAWFVSESHRGTKEAYKMVREYESWAQRRGCSFVTMADIHNLNDLDRIYNRMGYRLSEKTYIKEI